MRQTIVCFLAFFTAACTTSTAHNFFPPARYDHPFPGEVHVRDVDRANAGVCGRDRVACVVKVRPHDCYVVFNAETWGHRRADIMRHEIGHCNGWPGNHPR